MPDWINEGTVALLLVVVVIALALLAAFSRDIRGALFPPRQAGDVYQTAQGSPKSSVREHRATTLAATASNPIQRPPLPLREWLQLINHRPDQVPHLFIEGGSGAGKTTIATAILHDRPGPVAIVGVKPDDGWGEGYIYRSDERAAFLGLLLTEVRRRLDDDDRSGLTIVLDDFTRLASSHREAVELYKEVADVGRSLRIRLILIARGRQVKGIGASGESDLLDHFVFITVERGQHRAMLEMDEDTAELETRGIRERARPLPTAQWWMPVDTRPAEQPAAPGNFLNDLLAETPDADHLPPIPFIRPARPTEIQGEHTGTHPEHVPPTEHEFPALESDVTSSEAAFSLEEIAQIAAQIARGERERAEIIKAMPRYSGRKYKVYAAVYDRVRHAIEETTEQAA